MDPIFILLRLLVPLTIFHYPLAGGLASFFIDGADWGINFFQLAGLHAYYPFIDKALDVYYYTIEAYVVLSWTNGWAKRVGLTLYIWRVIGIGIFFLSHSQQALLFFPNIFESFFLVFLTMKVLLQKEPRFSKSQALIAVAVLGIPKIFQEYTMHVAQSIDWRYVPIHLPGGHTFIYDNLDHQMVITVIYLIIMSAILMRSPKKSSRK